MSEPLEISVFGGRIGESIVVQLPGNLWGVVDNYTPVLSKPHSNPTLRYLEAKGVTRLHFLCLTHPHHDHFRGMNYLLGRFNPDHIWIFDALDHKRLQSMVAAVIKGKAATSHLPQEKEKSDEFISLMDGIYEELVDKTRTPPLNIKRMAAELPLLKLSTDPPLTITALAVSGGIAMRYEHSLERCFTGEGSLNEQITGVNHNLISGGLLIEYGSARVILGGDMEKESWEEALKSFGPGNRLPSILFKASHHGSANGYCENLWETASPNRTCTAVITPYASQGLPSIEGLRHITTNSKDVCVTKGESEWSDSAVTFKGLSADALLAVQSLFPKSARDKSEGHWHFTIAPNGHVMQGR